ncbi:GntR family transcriptional regulator [Ferrimonas balearica]|nr:GntR family transcriptional regulator [Ferrimonas balearica]
MRKTNAEIAAEVRERICLNGGAGEILLHEGQLATEFGVSRTPIRQVLQMLAYENLVETRSGIGTIATPLDPGKMDADFRAFAAILTACSKCPTDQEHIAGQVLDRLRDARRFLDRSVGADSALIRALSAYLEATVWLVGDHILATALRSAYWRQVRWGLHPDRPKLDDRFAIFRDRLDDCVALAEAGDPIPLLAKLTELPVSHMTGLDPQG